MWVTNLKKPEIEIEKLKQQILTQLKNKFK